MTHRPDRSAPETTGECHHGAPRAVTDGGTPPDERPDSGSSPADGDGTTREATAGAGPDRDVTGDEPESDTETVEHDTISRRAMLGYTGGAALSTWALAGAGWYVFIHEPLEPEEELVREYFDAIDRDHYNTASRLFHEASPDSLWAAGRVDELSRMDISVENTEITDRWENADREAVEEWALVVADVEMDSGHESETFAIGILVAKNTAGEWRIWRDDEREGDAAAALG